MIFNNMLTLPVDNEEITAATPRVEELPESTLSELALSLYFDFDSYLLNKRALDEFNAWMARVDTGRIESLLLEGYADEFGEEEYNIALSKKRADTVASHLSAAGIQVDIETVGKGMEPMLESLKEEGQVFDNNFQSNVLKKPVWLTKEARRVDIIATIK
jgi:outer membrane protein OmpA-like peptidoglycan-associated protein